ncbi:NAD(+) diphosphatase [Pontibacter sp. JAM-7]|uniref:NAD(+) diphosphatase n=1 Tax=Pontibacter sp. JAM-7 TaxID=3366581 RepID=UPI003AF5B2C0
MKSTYWLAQDGKLLTDAEGVFCCSEQQLQTLPVEVCYVLGDNLSVADAPQLAILQQATLPEAVQAGNLRNLLANATDLRMATLLSRAAQLANWHVQFRYCPRCASALHRAMTEVAMRCPACERHYYPPTNPCVIVLVRNGNRCLLAHASRFADGRYSLLAGFIEAGETAEAAVAREVAEEVGIQLKNIRYIRSQSWPFPHSLMLGFFADYAGGEIQPDGEEIVHADWFGIDGLPVLPPKFSIARGLIEQFFQEIGAEAPVSSAAFFPTE